MIRRLLIFSLFFSLGCKQQENEDGAISKFCTLMGAINSIEVSVGEYTSWPEHIAYSINGTDIDYDDCGTNNSKGYSIKKEHRVFSAIAMDESDDFQSYFDQRGDEPNSDDISITFFGRASCSDPLVKLEAIDDKIQWTPSFPNGEACGQDGFSGRVSRIAVP